MKICLIGSTRFKDLYHEVNRELTAIGHVVYTVAWYNNDGENSVPDDTTKEILDLVHLRKIEESQGVVLVTDDTGYYGTSTRREMLWTRILDLPLYVWSGRNEKGVPTIHAWRDESALGIPKLEDIQKMREMHAKLFQAAGEPA